MWAFNFTVDRLEAIRTAFRLLWKAACFKEVEIEVQGEGNASNSLNGLRVLAASSECPQGNNG